MVKVDDVRKFHGRILKTFGPACRAPGMKPVARQTGNRVNRREPASPRVTGRRGMVGVQCLRLREGHDCASALLWLARAIGTCGKDLFVEGI
jgi:hypothetical protein